VIGKLIKIADHFDKMGLVSDASKMDSIIEEVSSSHKRVYVSGDIESSHLFAGLHNKLSATMPVSIVRCSRPTNADVEVRFSSLGGNTESITVLCGSFEVSYSTVKDEPADDYINYIIKDIKAGTGLG
jgi:hypothetical protein